MIKVTRYGESRSEPSETDVSSGNVKDISKRVTGKAGHALATLCAALTIWRNIRLVAN